MNDVQLTQRFERWVTRLPAAFRVGKLPYVFLFVCMVITVLLVYVAISPYQNASPMFLSMAGFLALLLGPTAWWPALS
jgi:hypothetical protein